jgi:histidinol-phosphate aminotransferase
LVANLPADSLLILDEAYADLAARRRNPRDPRRSPAGDPLSAPFQRDTAGGARVGYAIAEPSLALAFDKVRDHFGMGRIAQAGALAALADQDWLAAVQGPGPGRPRPLSAIARANGLAPLPSATNFVTVDLGRDGDFARRVLAECQSRGLFIRMPGVAPLDRCLRISLGPDAALDVVEEVLPQALAAAAAG